MERQVRVLMVVFNLAVANGVSSFVMNYFRKLDHRNVIMDFVVYQEVSTPYKNEILQAGGKIYAIPSIKNLKSHLEECKRIIVNGGYDVVHDNILILSYFVMYYAKKHKVPVRILHSHNSELGATYWKKIRNRLFLPLLRNQATDYFACSDLAATCMFGKMKYTFIPNIIDGRTVRFKQEIKNRVRQELKVTNKLVVITVGRLVEQKNPFYAIDVIINLKKQNKNIEYWWIGDGPLKRNVEEYIQKKDAVSYIHLLGRRTDVIDFYQGADVFFLPSIFEGLPVTGIEAQAVGLPCFVSDAITKEFIYTDLVEMFSLNNSPEETADKFTQWVARSHLDNDRTKYNKILMESKFSDQDAGKYLESIYKKIKLHRHEI